MPPQVLPAGRKIQPVQADHIGKKTDHQEQDSRNRQQNGQHGGIVDGFSQRFGHGIFADSVRAYGGQYIGRFGAARAQGGAVAAVVAQPDVGIAHQFVF